MPVRRRARGRCPRSSSRRRGWRPASGRRVRSRPAPAGPSAPTRRVRDRACNRRSARSPAGPGGG
ncbi:hypothetical protein E4P40_08955, partial [Blastococcus sp. CT_GayMR20]